MRDCNTQSTLWTLRDKSRGKRHFQAVLKVVAIVSLCQADYLTLWEALDATNDWDNGGRGEDVDFRTDCAEPYRSSRCSVAFMTR